MGKNGSLTEADKRQLHITKCPSTEYDFVQEHSVKEKRSSREVSLMLLNSAIVLFHRSGCSNLTEFIALVNSDPKKQKLEKSA